MGDMKIFAAGTSTAGKTCSICQSAIITGEHVVYCPDCALPFHHECWQENGGCSAYGCKSAPRTVKAEPAAQTISTIWGGEKPCPACGRSIRAQALKCRFCGATFETRDLVTADEYTRREYDGQEYEAARNKVIVMFLASVSGCLTPIALIVLSVLLVTKRIFGVEYRRLPAALRGMVVSGFGIGCLLVFLFLVLALFD